MSPTDSQRPLLIPLILGTGREGRRSEPVARFVFSQLSRRAGVETEFVDVRYLDLAQNGPTEETRDTNWATLAERADGFVIVTPEYNHGYPGMLKDALDMNLPEYNHKAVGICGVSAGPFGGSRVIENLLPIMRELGLVVIGTDVNFGNAGKLFDEAGTLLDESYVRRVDNFLNELIWMTRVLRHGRESIPPV
jgi:NAD(P)H-dependent FMN reductase